MYRSMLRTLILHKHERDSSLDINADDRRAKAKHCQYNQKKWQLALINGFLLWNFPRLDPNNFIREIKTYWHWWLSNMQRKLMPRNQQFCKMNWDQIQCTFPQFEPSPGLLIGCAIHANTNWRLHILFIWMCYRSLAFSQQGTY